MLAKCVLDTVEFINNRSPNAVSYHPAAGILLANSYFLISDAYKRKRGMQESRTHMYKVAAFTAAIFMAVRPVRVRDFTRVVTTAAAFANQQCAMRAAQGLLGLDLEKVDDDYIRRLYTSVLGRVELPCLASYLANFDSQFSPPRPVTLEEVDMAIRLDDQNIQLTDDELADLENLTNHFMMLERATAHPFLRILSDWKWWRWSWSSMTALAAGVSQPNIASI